MPHTMHSAPHFTLYSRSYCHLCEEMHLALLALRGEYAFDVDVFDIDADADMVARYDELVPVLIGQRHNAVAVPLCHYFLDVAKVRAFLSE
jgi:thiol-disulfide isomerase/thioredoxin